MRCEAGAGWVRLKVVPVPVNEQRLQDLDVTRLQVIPSWVSPRGPVPVAIRCLPLPTCRPEPRPVEPQGVMESEVRLESAPAAIPCRRGSGCAEPTEVASDLKPLGRPALDDAARSHCRTVNAALLRLSAYVCCYGIYNQLTCS
jgi:hypothetical protein